MQFSPPEPNKAVNIPSFFDPQEEEEALITLPGTLSIPSHTVIVFSSLPEIWLYRGNMHKGYYLQGKCLFDVSENSKIQTPVQLKRDIGRLYLYSACFSRPTCLHEVDRLTDHSKGSKSSWNIQATRACSAVCSYQP